MKVVLAGARIGYVLVPDGQSALLIHTDEHGANGIRPGTYAVHRKRARTVTVGRVVPRVHDHVIED